MKKYLKKQYIINEVAFNIYSDDLNKVDNYFKESVLESETQVKSEYNIYLCEEKSFFIEKIKQFNKNIAKIYDTFNNQQHYQFKNMYLIDNEEYLIEKIDDNNFVLYSNNKNKTCKNLLRVIREILVRDLEDKGYYFMHGNGIKIFDKGMLILGKSGSGKTTFTSKINSLEINQQFISNDRIFINEDEMVYFPLPIVYSMGTVKTNLKLDKYFKENNVLELRRGGNYETAIYSQKCDVPLRSIHEMFNNCENISSSTIDLIIFPRLTDKNEDVRILDKKESIEKLDSCNFTPNDTESNRRPWIKFRKTTIDELEEKKQQLYEILNRTKTMIDFPYSYQTTGDEIVKKLMR